MTGIFAHLRFQEPDGQVLQIRDIEKPAEEGRIIVERVRHKGKIFEPDPEMIIAGRGYNCNSSPSECDDKRPDRYRDGGF